MEEKSSIATILNLNCNIHENRKNFKIDDLPLLEYKLLKTRTKIKDCNTVENVCKYHKTQFVTDRVRINFLKLYREKFL